VDFGNFTALMDAFGFYWLAWNQYPHAHAATGSGHIPAPE
jgi:hypothetical protein